MQIVRYRSFKKRRGERPTEVVSIAAATKHIAEVFTNVQDKRHAADYDLATRFTRSDVLVLIEQAHDAIKDFKALPASNDKRFFLACLWAWSAIANR